MTGTYPREIAPLAEEVNELLRSNAQIIERARNQVGNLAHGLKTPIAVLRNEASAAKDDALAEVVLGRDRQDEQHGRHLSRPGADGGADRGGRQEGRRDAWSCCGWPG